MSRIQPMITGLAMAVILALAMPSSSALALAVSKDCLGKPTTIQQDKCLRLNW